MNENPDNEKINYNFDSAKSLLEQAGWKEKYSDGYLQKDGRIFEVEMPFVKGQDRFLTIYQEDLRKAGIKLNLKESDANIIFKLGNELNFIALPISWSGTFIPNPESYLKSETADSLNTLNWPGIKDKRIDELCDLYEMTFNQSDRIKIIREIDSIACGYHGYVFGWYAPYHRIAFQNKFGYPEWMLNKIGNYLGITYMWYNDPEKAAEYDAAKLDKSINLPQGTIENKYWLSNKEIKK